jgi:hypothetical protein
MEFVAAGDTNPSQSGKRIKVTLGEINELKRRHIMENLCYAPEEAGAIFGKSGKWAIERVKDGKLVAVDENAKPGKGGKGLVASTGLRITAASIEAFRKEYEIAPGKWSE